MTKLVKRVTAAVVAGVMAMSLAATSNAVDLNEAAPSEAITGEVDLSEAVLNEVFSGASASTCKHPTLTLVRTGTASVSNVTHEIRFQIDGKIITQPCNYNRVEFTCAYGCRACGTIVYEAPNIVTEQHFNTNCSLYYNGEPVEV